MTLVIMSILLIGIVLVGEEFAKRLSSLFSAQTEDVEGGVETLPAKLEPRSPRIVGATSPDELVVDAQHTGAWVRRATREATIVARRSIARNASQIGLGSAGASTSSPTEPRGDARERSLPESTGETE